MTAVGNTLRLAVVATLIGFVLGSLFGFVGGYFRAPGPTGWPRTLAVLGVSVPHYWLGMVMVIIFSAHPELAAGHRRRPRRLERLGLGLEPPAVHGAAGHHDVVIPMGIIARTVRALVAEILAQEFIVGLRAKGLTHLGIFATW
jgi:peptide/nickel transport system permease protein